MTRCPSDLALEEHLLDPERSALRPHLASCEACRERLARMEREGQEFRQLVFPRTVDAVTEAAGGRARRRRWLGALVPAAGLAAAGLLFLLVPRPPEDYLGVKGGPLGLTVFTGGPGGARALEDGAEVPAAAALRFQVRAAVRCRLWIVSVDAAGEVSRLHPPAGEEGAEVQGSAPLPGGALLDGKPGPERIFAVCSPDPIPLPEVERAVRAAAGGGADAVRRAGGLPGLPRGSAQATLLLEKRTAPAP